MLTSHETIKEAWSKFKSYPRFKELVIFNFLAGLPVILVSLLMSEEDTLANIITIIGTIPSLVVTYLTYISVTQYVCKDWVFNSFHEFLNPPSSIWRLFWKTMALIFMVMVPFALAITGISFWTSTVPMVGKITLGLVLIAVAGGFVFYIVKVYLAVPYFVMNDRAKILSALSFSDGYFWYLSKILGWMFLYGLLLIVFIAIALALFGMLASFLGEAAEAIFTCTTLVIQALIAILCAFIYAEAYKQIAQNKS